MPLWSIIMCLAIQSATSCARYILQHDYMLGNTFFDRFTFWTASDPTDGFVQYVSRPEAEASGLINQGHGQVTLAADSTSIAFNGRKSIRITSIDSYDSGLMILDLAHMPGSVCGSWPAFWMVGPDWPYQGEIDIIEGVNNNAFNTMTLHTGPNCSIENSTSLQMETFSGRLNTKNCNGNAPDQEKNQGCSIAAASFNTYGTGFNEVGGGVYAMQWTAESISIFFFSRGSIPLDINSDSPDPSSWGVPLSKFQGNCEFSKRFTNQQIVIDTTFCGKWAGGAWPNSTCASAYGSSCRNFVQQCPEAFIETFWMINGLKVFQDAKMSKIKSSSSPFLLSSLSKAAQTIHSVLKDSPRNSARLSTMSSAVAATKPDITQTEYYSYHRSSTRRHASSPTSRPGRISSQSLVTLLSYKSLPPLHLA